MPKYYHLITLGCQMNYSDSERIASVLESFGYRPTGKLEQADIIIYNSCSVRQKAEERILGLRRKWQELKACKPGLKIGLTGCMVTHGQYKLDKRLPELDFYFGIADLPKLPILLGLKKELSETDYFSILPSSQTSFQALLPIMTGCNNFCSYCIVPYARGREMSRPVAEILHEARSLISKGAREIILLGQNVNSYAGPDQAGKKVTFPQLLSLVDALPGYERLRFVSSHPKDCSPALIACYSKLQKLCPHMHLALQSGSDRILQAMNRRYTAADYLKLVKNLRQDKPDISLTTDIIVGFPGETEADFQATVKLVKQVGFEMIYIGMYSERPGTAAAKLKDDISPTEKKRRYDDLTAVLRNYLLQNNQRYLNQTVEVLIEQKTKKGQATGKTPDFKTVSFQAGKVKVGDLAQVKITEPLAWELRGELV